MANAIGSIAVTVTGGADGTALVFDVSGFGTLRLPVSALSEAVTARAVLHGMEQRIRDAGAVPRADKDGNIIPAEEHARMKWERMSRLVEHYLTGTADWSIAPAGDTGPKGGILFKALCRMDTGKTPEQLREWLSARSKKEQAALRNDPKVRAIIAEIEAETVADSAVDTQGLLAQIGA